MLRHLRLYNFGYRNACDLYPYSVALVLLDLYAVFFKRFDSNRSDWSARDQHGQLFFSCTKFSQGIAERIQAVERFYRFQNGRTKQGLQRSQIPPQVIQETSLPFFSCIRSLAHMLLLRRIIRLFFGTGKHLKSASFSS